MIFRAAIGETHEFEQLDMQSRYFYSRAPLWVLCPLSVVYSIPACIRSVDTNMERDWCGDQQNATCVSRGSRTNVYGHLPPPSMSLTWRASWEFYSLLKEETGNCFTVKLTSY